MKTQLKNRLTANGRTIFLLFAISIFLAACAAKPSFNVRAKSLGTGTQLDPYIVTINFKGVGSCEIIDVEEDPASCNAKPSTELCASRGDFIRWLSNPAGIQWKIYFDPIQGATIISDANGKKRKKIDDDAPFGYYKYSILGIGCNKDTDTYDPYMRVNN